MTRLEIIQAINDIIFSVTPETEVMDIFDDLNDLIERIKEEENPG